MKLKLKRALGAGFLMLVGHFAQAQNTNVDVDVNLNIKHSVGGVSDFGRERHITLHSAISENDWNGEADKMEYLLNDLDVYLGRDNGRATFQFKQTPVDPNRANYPDIAAMDVQGTYWNGIYDELGPDRQKYESRATEMIAGTNPHPTYPTLSWNLGGFTDVDPKWQPLNIQTSADWVVEYLDKYFEKNAGGSGPPLPKYWEVINEPDMIYMTGQFMVTSPEKIWEYHNLVAEGVKQRLGNKAPMIGGMTWGLHDFFLKDGIARFGPTYYDQWITDNPSAQQFYRDAAASPSYPNRDNPWFQWDVQWRGFMEAAGANMDFYSVHIYDWPVWETTGGVIRSGGHTENMLEMMEWYDHSKFGKTKPIVISEYGAVGPYVGKSVPYNNPSRRDWENLMPFSHMLLQFLERPDHVIKSMPFTPVKAIWGNHSDDPVDRYPYTMLDDRNGDGDWEWSEFIKWYELWADVDGTRIDTKASDLDMMVDAYVDKDIVYLILSNLETSEKTVNLNTFGVNGNNLQNVRIKHLHLSSEKTTLSDNTQNNAPSSITVGAGATMILAYKYSNNVTINQTSVEKKYFGESLSGTVPNRVELNGGTLTARVNGVSVPSKGEAMLRIGGNFFYNHITKEDSRNVVTVNGHNIDINYDWRGEQQGKRNTFFGVLEIPVPLEYLQTNNTITCKFLNKCEYTQANIQVWDMSITPGRTNAGTPPPVVAVTSVSVTPINASVAINATQNLSVTVSPNNATNQAVSWASSNTSIAQVNNTGIVTGIAAGSATITVTTDDGNKTATSNITVTGGGNPNPPTPGDDLVIEAESFSTTGGTFNDGNVPLGVNRGANDINFVNSNDWAEYTINIAEAGEYKITYLISSPSDNAQIQIAFDGTTASTDNVVNNGSWNNYQALEASNTVTLTSGTHTVRITASGSNNWQWNLDKITLTKVGGNSNGSPNEFYIVNRATGQKLISQNDTSGSAINLAASNSTSAYAKWTKKESTGGYFFLENVGSGMYIRPNNDQANSQVIQRPTSFSGSWTQWQEITTTAGYFRLESRVANNLIASGTNAIASNLTNNSAQWIYQSTTQTGKFLDSDQDTSNIEISAYPNPVVIDYLFIEGLQKNKDYSYNLYDTNGASIIRDSKISTKKNSIDFSSIASGVYFLSINSDQGKKVIQLIKE